MFHTKFSDTIIRHFTPNFFRAAVTMNPSARRHESNISQNQQKDISTDKTCLL